MIFESHAHYDDRAFDTDRDALLSSMKDNGIEHIINVSAELPGVTSTLELARKYPFIYAAVGIHPSDVSELDEEKFNWLREQAKQDKVVAIGEVGLDYHYPDIQKDIQKKWFERQLQLSKELDLPVIIHSRDAAADTLDIMRSEAGKNTRGVVHCFSYTVETAKIYLDMGYSIGVGGVLTFSNAKKLVEAVEYIPMDRILLETDSPYLAPTPHRGERNSSLYLPLVAKRLAEIKNMDYDEVVEITSNNAKQLFSIK